VSIGLIFFVLSPAAAQEASTRIRRGAWRF